ncbi:MAG: LacI family transcriptional regulator [Actinobacteria bacterium]|nr:LacI family transcriptional regulator [Actinomycetota bacterium]
MATIRDVAVKAKTSIATVSAVINDSTYVSKDLKARVEGAIKELDFVPNVLAGSLKSKKSYQIGILISDIRNIFYAEFYRGFEDVVKRKRYNILLCNSDNNVDMGEEYFQLLAQKRVDGVVITVSNTEMLDETVNFKKYGIPLVLIDLIPKDPSQQVFSHVGVDGFEGAKIAVQHLIDNGYTRIAVVSHYAQYRDFKERIDGYVAALEENGIKIHKEYIKMGGFSNIEAVSLTRELLDLPDPPDAIFATNNRMILGVLQEVQDRHIRIPDELALVGFDDFEWAKYLNPPLTTVQQPAYEIGVQAARELFRLIRGGSNVRTRIIKLPTKLMIRESSIRKD